MTRPALISVKASLTRMTPLGLGAVAVSSTATLSFRVGLVDPAGEESSLLDVTRRDMRGLGSGESP